ncbi:hypothetical protein [Kitasatospora phosalacinea]|uniref:Uncharacterized protein n=1 Tax=Kitasatospora phosalacinea TaxID=2065 RepID=A0ABW6GRH8_9ACTN
MASSRRPRIEWPDGEDYRPCGRCSRCVSGTGRDRDPNASDCYVDMLDAAAQPTRRSA